MPSQRQPLSVKKARTCLLLNAFVCPGMGSLMARRLSGWPQLFLALGGAGWSLWGMWRLMQGYALLLQVPPEWRDELRAIQAGLGLLFIGWLWSIVTGISVFRKARQDAASMPPEIASGPDEEGATPIP